MMGRTPDRKASLSAHTVTITPTSATFVAKSERRQFSAEAADEFGNTITAVADWQVRDSTIASVDGSGLVTALDSAGTTWLVATSGLGADSAAITLDRAATVILASITKDTIEIGELTDLSAVAQDSAGFTIPGYAITWTVRDTTVAGLETGNQVAGRAVGQTYAVASAAALGGGSVFDSVLVTVIDTTVVVGSAVVEPTMDPSQAIGHPGRMAVSVSDVAKLRGLGRRQLRPLDPDQDPGPNPDQRQQPARQHVAGVVDAEVGPTEPDGQRKAEDRPAPEPADGQGDGEPD
jgi:hypothetical protein